jgi:hypothetical protein
MKHQIILALVLLWLATTTGVVVVAAPTIVFPTGVGTTLLYTVFGLPSNGSIYYNGNIVLSVPFAIANTSLLTYEPVDPYAFSGAGACNTSSKYDSFSMNLFIYPSLVNTTTPALVCLTDTVQAYPVVADDTIYVDVGVTSFTLAVSDENNRVGTFDNKPSAYGFVIGNGAGIVFSNVLLSVGVLLDCNGRVIVQGTKYNQTTFCVNSTDVTWGTEYVTIVAVDNAGGQSEVGATYIFSTLELNTTTKTVLSVEPQDATTVGTIPVLLETFVRSRIGPNINHQIIIDSASLTLGTSGDLYEDSEGTVAVTIGKRYNTYDVFYFRPGEYNRYFFPEYNNGTAFFSNPDGTSVQDNCADPVNGCVGYITYRAVNNSFSSDPGYYYFVVDRVITEVITVCATSDFSIWDEACASYGEQGSIIPIYLAGNDSHPTNPMYKSIILSLPTGGSLYYNLQDANVYVVGPLVQVGDTVQAINSYIPPLLYIGDPGYFNRFQRKVEPDYYISIQDETGVLVGPECLNLSTCFDTINYKVVSGINSSLESSIGTYNIVVTKTIYDQLTVCATDGFSPWNESCSSFGYESNDLQGDYDIGIFFNVNNTNGETVNYVITSLPAHGTLYYNSGNSTVFDRGDLVSVGDEINPAIRTIQPYFVYVGYSNYFNDLSLSTVGVLLYGDKKDNIPFGTCPLALTRGCPDTIGFYAITTETQRMSNPGKYSIFVHNVISNKTLSGPDTIVYTPGVNYYFGELITYEDPDGNSFQNAYRFTFIDGVIGVDPNVSLANITFPEVNILLNTTGCYSYLDFLAYPSDAKKLISKLYLWVNESLDSFDESVISFAIVSRTPDGMSEYNTYRLNPNTDVAVGIDIAYLSTVLSDDEIDAELADIFEDSIELQQCQDENNALKYALIAVSILLGFTWIGNVVYCFMPGRRQTRLAAATGAKPRRTGVIGGTKKKVQPKPTPAVEANEEVTPLLKPPYQRRVNVTVVGHT